MVAGPEFTDRIDPEIAEALARVPLLDLRDIPAARAEREELAAAARVGWSPPAGVRTCEVQVAGLAEVDSRIDPRRTHPVGGQPEVTLRVHAPTLRGDAAAPVLLWLHGGGHVLGSAAQDDPFLARTVARTGCVAVAVEWRRAPEHPYPAALLDAVAGLRWCALGGGRDGVPPLDPDRVVVGGASSGGGLAAGLALWVRDQARRAAVARDGDTSAWPAELPLAAQVLVYPMLDDRHEDPASEMVDHPRLWTATSDALAWDAYLGGRPEPDDGDALRLAGSAPHYAVPAQADELGDLPATWLATGELDGFRDADLDYATRLMRDGVPTELHVYPGAVHGFDVFAPGAGVSVRFRRDLDEALDRVLRMSTPGTIRDTSGTADSAPSR